MQTHKKLAFLFLILLFGCGKDVQYSNQTDLRFGPVIFNCKDMFPGDSWIYEIETTDLGSFLDTVVVLNRDTIFDSTPCFILKHSCVIEDGIFQFNEEPFRRRNTKLSRYVYVSKQDNIELGENSVMSFDISSVKESSRFVLPCRIEESANKQFDGTKPEFLFVGKKWEETFRINEMSKFWLGNELVENSDTSYTQKRINSFLSIDEITVSGQVFNCPKIGFISKDSKGNKIEEGTYLFSTQVKNVVMREQVFFERNLFKSQIKSRLVKMNILDINKITSEEIRSSDTIYLLICILAFFVFSYQLQEQVFSHLGDFIGYLTAFVISVFLYFALTFVLLYMFHNKLLCTVVLSITCFVIPFFRYRESRRLLKSISLLGEERLGKEIQTEEKIRQMALEKELKPMIKEKERESLYNYQQLINEIKKEIGDGAFDRWHQLALKMHFESEMPKADIIAELIAYGLNERTAEKMMKIVLK
jgi:hypothetical protein